MDSKSDCAICHQKVQSLQFLKCQGFCENVVHLNCTSLTIQNMRVVQQDANLFWFCNDCVALMQTPHLRAAYVTLGEAFNSLNEAHKTALEDVKKEVQNNTESVKELSTKLSAPPPTPTWPTKGKRRANEIQSPDQPIMPKIPKTAVGKRVIPGLTIPVIARKVAPDDLWWIWLSGFQSSVTEPDIRSLVKGCLSCEDDDPIEVKILVKKGIDVSTLPSVTFKVGVEKRFQESSLEADNWPEGVSFRPFVDFGMSTGPERFSPGFTKTARTE